jgi:two-component system CheB/CheR fusion protein
MKNLATTAAERIRQGLSRGRATIVAMLLGGSLFAWWMVARADRELREALIQQAQLVAQALDVDHVRAMTGTRADRLRPDYAQLKQRLAAVCAANRQCRFLYLMGCKQDGTVFFLADSEPPGSPLESSPGQVYDEASNDCRGVFSSQTAIVEGPISDRWGQWVSAMVPLAHPTTGDVVALLGMDVDAREWRLNVAAQSALPVGLMLLLLIGAGTALIASRRVGVSPKPVSARLLPPLAAMVVVLIVGAGGAVWQEHQRELADKVTSLTAVIDRDLNAALDQQGRGLAAAIAPIAADATVKEALGQRDTDRLFSDWQPLFQKLHQDINLTHFYFFDAQRVCLLRIHSPEKRGDRIDRFTALEAERTGKTASGIELGPLGTFTLRVVSPVVDGDRLVGYVEFGKEIEELLDGIRDLPGVDLAVVIDKQHLQRPTWERGMRLLGREADWDRLPDSVIIYASQGRLPDAFLPTARLGAPDRLMPDEADTEFSLDGNRWQVSAIPLRDASDETVGSLLVMRDISADEAAFARLATFGGAAGAVLLALLLGFIHVLLRQTDAGIRAQQAELRASEERLSATLRSIGDGVVACDVEGRIATLNAVAEKLTGWTTDEARGRRVEEIFRIIHAETRQEAEVPIGRALREDRVVELANRTALIARDGSERHIADSCAPIHDAAGRVIGAVLVFRDVTAEYLHREQLRESKARFDQLAEQNRTIAWEIDASGLYTYVSHVMEQILGYRADELVGRVHFHELHPESGRETFKAKAFEVFASQKPFVHVENAVQAKDGRVLWFSTNGIPLLDSDGTLRGYRGSDTDITERKKTEAALVESEKRHRLLIEHAVSGIAVHEIVLDASGRPVDYIFLDANPAFETHTGLRVDHILGRRASEVLPGIEKEPFIEMYGNVVATGEAISVEQYSEVLGRHYFINAYRLDKRRFATVFADITARKQAEETIRNDRWRLQSIIDGTQAGTWEWNVQTGETIFNETWARILGYTLAELEPISIETWQSLAHPDDFKRSAELLERHLAGELASYDCECRMRHKNGHWVWVLDRGKIITRTDDGKPLMMFGTHTDITERKRAEEALLESEARIRAITDSAHDAILMIDPRGDISYWNPAAESILGYRKEEAIGQCLHKLVVPNEYFDAHQRAFSEFVRTGLGNAVGKTVELVARRKDGREIAVALSLSAVSLQGQWHAIGILRDTSDRKRAEQELKQTVEALESANRALEEFSQLTESATRAKSEFLANMSHEIRTPMTAILGYADVLLNEPGIDRSPPDRIEAIRTIQRNGTYLLDLINDILDLSKVEAGKMHVERTACAPMQVLADVASLMRVRADAKRLPLTVECTGCVPATIQNDPLRLRQVLINLVGNAIKFTEKGSVRIVARLAQRLGKQPLLQVDVIDTGVGLTPQQMSGIFQPFNQADSSTTRKFGGTGLGLTISKRLAEVLGGDITVSSVPGKGSTFSLTVETGDLAGVPMLQSPVEVATAPPPTAARPAPSATRLDGRILLAEDGLDNQRLIHLLLTKAGASVTLAENGQVVCELALAARDKGEPFDVILMDMQMPVMDGYQATYYLRCEGYTGPILALTAHAMAGAEAKCLAAGCDGYLTKPLDRASFLPAIASWLQPSLPLLSTARPLDDASGRTRGESRD